MINRMWNNYKSLSPMKKNIANFALGTITLTTSALLVLYFLNPFNNNAANNNSGGNSSGYTAGGDVILDLGGSGSANGGNSGGNGSSNNGNNGNNGSNGNGNNNNGGNGNGNNQYSGIKVGDVIVFNEIEWIVLEIKNGKAFILSKYLFEGRSYVAQGEAYSVTWETSDMRRYLNDDFYHTFSTENKSLILQTTVVNGVNPWWNTDRATWWNATGGNDTYDRIFLLSIEEVVRYFGDSGDFARKYSMWNGVEKNEGTLTDEYNDARKAATLKNKEFFDAWWLRTVGSSNHYGTRVANDGGVAVEGLLLFFDGFSLGLEFGVRPAMWINIVGGKDDEPPQKKEEPPKDQTPEVKMHTIIFDLNGGTYEGGGELEQQIPDGGAAVPPITKREGYTFREWSIDITNIRGGTRVFARWTENSETNDETFFTVTFNLAGGTRTGGGDLTQTVRAGGSAAAPTVERSGHTFDGWDREFNNVTANITVTARWTASAAQPAGGSVRRNEGIIVELDKETYAPEETMSVTVKNLPREMETAGAFIAVYAEGARHGDYEEFKYPTAGESEHRFYLYYPEGNYEIRLYRRDYIYTDETFVLSVPFAITK